MCFERPAGVVSKKHKNAALPFFRWRTSCRQTYSYRAPLSAVWPDAPLAVPPCRGKQNTETVLPDGLPFLYHCFSPLYTDAKARCKQTKTCASFAVSPSQGTAQPTAAWKNRRGGASAPIRYGRLFRRIRREGKSPSVRSYIPYTPADARPATCRSRRSRCGYPQTRGRLHRHNAGGSARRSAAFPDCAPMESDLPQYPFCSTPYTACSWVNPSNSSWSISLSREKAPDCR